MKKINLLLTLLLGLLLISGCSSSDEINTASDEVSEDSATETEPVDEVENTLDDELLSDDNDVEIGELI